AQSNLPRPADPRGRPDPNLLTAEQKIRDAADLDELTRWLTPPERVLVAGSPALLAQMAALPDVTRVPFI
ncbi:MAG: hypothetical protein JSS24_11755, partial [Proteobacteria bacterium]|nr:hypothetical protein [Pseudomonadota bacterium]